MGSSSFFLLASCAVLLFDRFGGEGSPDLVTALCLSPLLISEMVFIVHRTAIAWQTVNSQRQTRAAGRVVPLRVWK